jgi:hypothetical protein
MAEATATQLSENSVESMSKSMKWFRAPISPDISPDTVMDRQPLTRGRDDDEAPPADAGHAVARSRELIGELMQAVDYQAVDYKEGSD